jgi:hypothetical protein
MKRNSCLVAGALLIYLQSFSQQVTVNEPDLNKPKLFQSMPARIPVKMAALTSLFDGVPGQHIDINLSDSAVFRFEGDVRDVTEKYEARIRTVIIRSVNFPGANLSISKITGTDGQTRYQGRLLSFAHGDLYQLQLMNNGSYALVKKNFYDLINE